MGKSKKIDLVAIIVFSVLVIAIVMAIVGVCIDWTSTTSSAAVVGSSTSTSKLSELADANKKLVDNGADPLKGFGAMSAFAYITLALAALTTVVYVLSKFLNVSFLKWVVIGLSALLVISAIVAIATTFSFCSNYKMDASIGGVNLANSKTSPAAGPWLLSIFGILGGAAGVFGALKK